MKKILIIAMVGMMLTGVGCKQTDKVTEDIDKNTKQIEEYQEEKPVEKKKSTAEERYEEAEKYIEEALAGYITNDDTDVSCEFTIAREKNVICIRMGVDIGEYNISQAYDLYGYTKQEVYELLGFDIMLESLDIMASNAQTEVRSRFGHDICIVVDSYFGEDRIYCVDGDGNVEYNYFDEQ